jgi:hypothetical protein
MITQEPFFAFILIYDFTVRVLRLFKLSPFFSIAQFFIVEWGVTPKLCDESPKRFALYMGFVISLILVVLFSMEYFSMAAMIAIILFFCALLETLFDFCIGCKIYYAIKISKGFLGNDRNFK